MSLQLPLLRPPHRLTADLARLQQSRAYDLLMRLPLSCWSAVCTAVWMNGLVHYMRSGDPTATPVVYAVNIAMRLSAIAFLLLLAVSVVLRARPTGKARGIEPRVSALGGSFIVYAFGLFPRSELSLVAEIAATSLTLIGSAASVLVLAQLGPSFSVMAEARRLVTRGVYRFLRHPLYLSEELATIGIFVQFCSPWAAALLIAQIAFQLRRMHNEEKVLAEAFPEYPEYQAKTARLIPGLY